AHGEDLVVLGPVGAGRLVLGIEVGGQVVVVVERLGLASGEAAVAVGVVDRGVEDVAGVVAGRGPAGADGPVPFRGLRAVADADVQLGRGHARATRRHRP